MIIIGEKLNSSIPKTLEAFNQNDEEYIISLIKSQESCGADYLDINTAVCENEVEKLRYVTGLVLKHSKCGIMLDSPSPQVIKEAIGLCEGRKVIINSVTVTERIDELLPVIKETGAGVVGLPIDEDGIPSTVERRVENAKKLIQKITGYGISESNIYIDVLAETLATDSENAITAIRTIGEIAKLYPNVNTTCGLSNVSFGLPKRMLINSAFLAMAIANGLTSAILDITSLGMRNMLFASLALVGQDEYCMDFITHIRESEE